MTHRDHRVELGVFAAAVALRLAVPLLGGGLRGYAGYDPGVYYAAADALTFGKVPYRDYPFVHPPGVVLALTPAALVGRLTDDRTGQAVGNLLCLLLGALACVLVVRIVRTLGHGGGPALAAGLFAACWWGSIQAEAVSRLEPLGNVLFAAGLWCWLRGRDDPGRRQLYAGLLLGLACCVKIWWALPLAVLVLADLLVARSLRRTSQLVVGAVAAGVVVIGPFLLLAPSRMLHLTIGAQLGRPHAPSSVLDRLDLLTGTAQVRLTAPAALGTVLFLVLGCLLAASVGTSLVRPASRVVAALVVLQVVVLLTAPSAYTGYADYLTVSLAVCVGCAAARVRSTRRMPVVGGLLAVALVATVLRLGDSELIVATVPHRDALARAVDRVGCATSGSPGALIALDALTKSFGPGCLQVVDLFAQHLGDGQFGGAASHRTAAYLTQGDAVLLVPGTATMTRADRRLATRGGVLATNGVWTLYRVAH